MKTLLGICILAPVFTSSNCIFCMHKNLARLNANTHLEEKTANIE